MVLSSSAGTTLRALRSRNYRLFFLGQLVSLVGTWMQSVAQSWLVYRLTGSEALLGVVGFCGQIPVLLLAPLGGTVADRVPKRSLIVVTQAASMVLALALAVLTLADAVHVSHVFALAALLGVINAFDMPARQSFAVEMVGKADLTNAIALNSSVFNGARFVGPAIAGFLVAAIGEGWCFLANGLSYLGVIAGLLAMRGLPPVAAHARRSAAAEILEGFFYIGRTAPIRTLLLLLGTLALFGLQYTVLMPVFADRVLGGGVRELGWLMGAAGFGALLGALALARRERLQGLSSWIAEAACGFGLALAAFALSRRLALSLPLLVAAGFCMMVAIGGGNTLIQSLAADRLRGRVMAVYAMTFMGAAPIGAILSGWLAERIGAPLTVAWCGGFCVLAGLVFARQLPHFRAVAAMLRRENQAAQQVVPATAVPRGVASDGSGSSSG